MAGFEIGASVISVIGLTIQITQVIIKFGLDLKDAPKDIRMFITELQGLKTVLSETNSNITMNPGFKEAFQDQPSAILSQLGPNAIAPANLKATMEACLAELEKLLNQLKRNADKSQAGWNQLKDILLVNSTRKSVNKLHRQCRIINSLVSVDTAMLGVMTLNEVKEARREQQEWHETERNRKILQWLSPLRFQEKQRDIITKRYPRTGNWFLELGKFKAWRDNMREHSTLWCYGIPGAGKTVIASIAIDHLTRTFTQKDVAVAFVYCDYKDPKNQTASTLLSSLVQQLVQQHDSMPSEARQIYEDHGNGKGIPHLDEYEKLLQSLSTHFRRTFILVDALDECSGGSEESRSHQWTLLNILLKLQQLNNNFGGCSLFITSRGSHQIEARLTGQICIEIRATDSDVASYIESRITDSTKFRFANDVEDDPNLGEAIIAELVKNAKGMFLLPRLHLDLLGSQTSVRGLRKALNDLPAKLGDVYESTMTRIKGQHEEDCKLAMQTLYWIFYALRPLQIQELQHALAVELGDRGFNKEGVPSEKLLTSVCAGLISINAESNSMSLVHFTVEEYFKNTGRKWFPEASVRIAEACLTYISFDVFGGGSCGNDRELNNRLLDYPFLQYAARSWGVHAYGDPESQVKELAEEFLGDDLKLSTSIQARDCPSHRYAGFSQKYSKGVAGLQVASAFGLKEIVNLLLERGANAETWDDEGRTPLYWAAKYGHEEVVRLLLEKRADVDDAQDEVGFMALHCAAKNGHEAVVQLLLKSGASIENAWDEEGRTALHWATENGHETVVRLLLEKGADAGGLDGKLTTPLHLAAKNGHQGIVRLLLEKGADIAAKDEEGRMPLHKATENGHEAMVSLLIEQGVDVNAKGKYGWTALHEAVWYREEKLVRLLMENGADVAAKDEWGQMPLHWAAEVGHEISVRLLVENGADIATEDQRGRTALHRATKNGNRVVIQLLTSSS